MITGAPDNLAKGSPPCTCSTGLPLGGFASRSVGVDEKFGELSLLTCSACGQAWLNYSYEIEGISRSGRWYRIPISGEEARDLSLDNWLKKFHTLGWYLCGGSYYDGKIARIHGKLVPSF